MIRLENLTTAYGKTVIHDNISLVINKGEIFGLVGGSGSGKTTLLKQMILLQKPKSGKVYVLGKDINALSDKEQDLLRRKWGVLFQFGALFTTLSVLENIMSPLQEYTKLPKDLIKKIALLKLQMVGLDKKVAHLYPAELSGGMKKRAGLARALALDPKLLFLDEPTSGLDPKSAREFDGLIKQINKDLNVTVVMITHDKDTVTDVLDRFAVLGEKKILATGDFDTLQQTNPKLVASFMT
jgi:phospholipid/cholesterol/gamma-HCH transport system ATP-binding protein